MIRVTRWFAATMILTITAVASGNIKTAENEMADVFEFTMKNLDGESVNLERYRGAVLLIVNVASECGYTYQYEGLQNLHENYSDRGLTVLGFPSNDFGQQEPGSAAEIKNFCERNYGVEFDIFAKIVVSGTNKVPLYKYLTSNTTNPDFPGEVEWNFEKFLIDRDGEIIRRFRSSVEPESREITLAIESALALR